MQGSYLSKPAHHPFIPAYNPFVPAHNPFTPAHDLEEPAHNPFVPAHDPFALAHDLFILAYNPFTPAHDPVEAAHDPFVPAHHSAEPAYGFSGLSVHCFGSAKRFGNAFYKPVRASDNATGCPPRASWLNMGNNSCFRLLFPVGIKTF